MATDLCDGVRDTTTPRNEEKSGTAATSISKQAQLVLPIVKSNSIHVAQFHKFASRSFTICIASDFLSTMKVPVTTELQLPLAPLTDLQLALGRQTELQPPLIVMMELQLHLFILMMSTLTQIQSGRSICLRSAFIPLSETEQ